MTWFAAAAGFVAGCVFWHFMSKIDWSGGL